MALICKRSYMLDLDEPLVLNSQTVDSSLRESKYPENYLSENKLPRVLTQHIPPFRVFHLAWHKRRQQSIDNKYLSESGADIHALWDGVEFVTENLWPLMFWGMLGYDVFNYLAHSNNRYEVTFTDLVIGLPKNYHYRHSALTINLGGDIAGCSNFWPWAGMLGVTVLSGFIFRYMSRPGNKVIAESEEETSSRSCGKIFYQDFIQVFPLRKKYRIFHQQKRSLLQSRDREEKKQDIEKIQASYLPYEGQVEGLPKLKEALQLAKGLNLEPIFGFSLFKISLAITHRYYFAWKLGVDAFSEIALHRRDEIGEFALKTLIELSGRNPYIHYKLWSIGQSQNSFVNLMGYFVVVPGQLYTKYRLWALIITKVILLAKFLNDQKNCHDQDKKWRFVSEIGNYDCTVCDGDVDYRRSKEGQGCVDALSEKPRSAQEFLDTLTVVQSHGPFTRIDFSKQPWTNWPISVWKKIIHLLSSSAFDDLITFDLSNPAAEKFAITPDYLDYIADFLQFSSVRYLDLSRQIISPQGMTALLPGFRNNTRLLSVYFTDSQLTDSTFLSFITLLPGMSSLSTLGFSDNQLSGFALKSLSNFSNPNLTYLDVSHNSLQTGDIDQFPWNLTSLKILNISQIDLSNGSLNQFGARLVNSSLTTLVMDNCQIPAALASSLFNQIARSSIHTLSWGNNNIGYQVMQTIAPKLVTSDITDFNLNDNSLDDRSLNLLATSLALNITLRQLSLSGNIFTAVGFGALISALSTSRLRSLIVSRIALGDAGVSALTVVPPYQLLLTQLDLSSTSITSVGASALFYYVANSSVTDLDVSHNFLGGDIGTPLQVILNRTPLKRLNLADTLIRSENLQSAWSVLPDSSLEFLDVSDNNLNDPCAISLVQNWMSPVPNSATVLNSTEEDFDYKRAINRATPTTKLEKLIGNSNMLTEQGAYALCLGAHGAGINTTNLILSGEHLISGASRINGCPILVSFNNQTSAATPASAVSWLLMTSFIGLTIGPQISKYPWRIFTACAGAILAFPLGFPGIAVGAALGYKAKEISIGALKELNLFVTQSFHREFVFASKADEKTSQNFYR